MNPRTSKRLLSRLLATLSPIRNGGEGRGEEALWFMDLRHELMVALDSLSANFYWGRGLGRGGAPVHGKVIETRFLSEPARQVPPLLEVTGTHFFPCSWMTFNIVSASGDFSKASRKSARCRSLAMFARVWRCF